MLNIFKKNPVIIIIAILIAAIVISIVILGIIRLSNKDSFNNQKNKKIYVMGGNMFKTNPSISCSEDEDCFSTSEYNHNICPNNRIEVFELNNVSGNLKKLTNLKLQIPLYRVNKENHNLTGFSAVCDSVSRCIYILGGFYQKDYGNITDMSRDLFKYDTKNKRWSTIKISNDTESKSFAPRTDFSAKIYKGFLYVIGGLQIDNISPTLNVNKNIIQRIQIGSLTSLKCWESYGNPTDSSSEDLKYINFSPYDFGSTQPTKDGIVYIGGAGHIHKEEETGEILKLNLTDPPVIKYNNIYIPDIDVCTNKINPSVHTNYLQSPAVELYKNKLYIIGGQFKPYVKRCSSSKEYSECETDPNNQEAQYFFGDSNKIIIIDIKNPKNPLESIDLPYNLSQALTYLSESTSTLYIFGGINNYYKCQIDNVKNYKTIIKVDLTNNKHTEILETEMTFPHTHGAICVM